MKSEIISIGSELLMGEISDTNASYLARTLPLLGIDLLWITQVGDDNARLNEIFKGAWERSDLIIASGGLGPTADDLTREAIASLLEEDMTVDPELERWLRSVFSKLGYEMPACNIKQATLIPSASAIPNPRGTAPGWWVERDGHTIIALPGPPSELQRMWEREVFPKLHQRLSHTVILSRTFKLFGLGESTVNEMLGDIPSSNNPALGIYSKPDGIHLRIIAKSESHEDAAAKLAQLEFGINKIFLEYIWGIDNETLEGIIGSLLIAKKLKLATMESCTGGLLANTITDIAASSDYYNGGLVAYCDEMLIDWGVDAHTIHDYGVASPEVAQAMATTARQRLVADIGVSITGVAGPNESEGKPPGTIFMAIDNGIECQAISGKYPPRRLDVKRRATAAALFELRKTLLNLH